MKGKIDMSAGQRKTGLKTLFDVLWLVPIFCGLTSGVLYAKGVAAELTRIKESCMEVDADVKDAKHFGVTLQYLAVLSNSAPQEWKAFRLEEEFQSACPKGCYRSAIVYYFSETPVLVSYELKSDSKEWVQYLKYYFREDGTLEKIHWDLRRFGAYEKSKGMEQQFLVKVVRDRFYDASGKCIKKSNPRCFNMSTGTEVRDVIFTDVSLPFYKQIGDLPFYKLLIKI
jgi:hypothetical protein